MAVQNTKAVFECNVERVWEVVTSLTDYSWRSDLGKIEKGKENQFIEYTKDGYATTFTITVQEPCKRWELDMENDNMKGHWVGVFTQEGKETEVDFTEDVQAKKLWMKPFVRGYLKKQQKQYIQDLKRALE